MESNFRLLKAEDIDCRVGTVKKETVGGQQVVKFITLLLYKNARVDMNILDEVYGKMNWQRKHEFKDGKLYCTVSVYDSNKGEWIDKEDVGTESNADAEKGQASDSFKRACVNWGIGRELYTAPFILIRPLNGETIQYTKFSVSEVEYNTQNEIIKLTIVDNNNVVRWTTENNKQQSVSPTPPPPPATNQPSSSAEPKPAAKVKTRREKTIEHLKNMDAVTLKQYMDYFQIEDVDRMTDKQVEDVIAYERNLKNQQKK